MEERLKGEAVEYNLTEHCNLKCSGCDHASPHFPEKFAVLEQFREELTALASALAVTELKLVGGEPLQHPRLLDFLRVAREVGLAQRLTVVTNGLLLPKIDPAFWGMVNRVWISVYPGIKYKVPLSQYEQIAKEHGVEIWIKNSPSFRRTLLTRPIDDPQLLQTIYERCEIAHVGFCHTIYEGRYYKCSPAPFMPYRLGLLGRRLENASADSVAIVGNSRLREDLEEYLRSPKPLAACQYCLGTAGKLHPVRQLNRAALAAELADTADARELIDPARLEKPVDFEQDLDESVRPPDFIMREFLRRRAEREAGNSITSARAEEEKS